MLQLQEWLIGGKWFIVVIFPGSKPGYRYFKLCNCYQVLRSSLSWMKSVLLAPKAVETSVDHNWWSDGVSWYMFSCKCLFSKCLHCCADFYNKIPFYCYCCLMLVANLKWVQSVQILHKNSEKPELVTLFADLERQVHFMEWAVPCVVQTHCVCTHFINVSITILAVHSICYFLAT